MLEAYLHQTDAEQSLSVEQALLVLLQHISELRAAPRRASNARTSSAEARRSKSAKKRPRRTAASVRNKLLTPEQAAKRLSLSQKTLANYRSQGIGPKFVRLSGRAIRYQVKDLRDYIDQRSFENTSEADNWASDKDGLFGGADQ